MRQDRAGQHPSGVPIEPPRTAQLAYSDLQPKMHDEQSRRRKARKIGAVVQHFLGRDTLEGLVLLDVGSSTGFIADELRATGATVIGIDIDVPGLISARRRFGSAFQLTCADGARLPFPDRSIDLVVFNHIYEHVVDPDAVMAEIRRVLRTDGIVYLGFANRYTVIEPHYRLPLLSWLPPSAADRYVSASGRAPRYYERLRSRRDLLRMCTGLSLWDYTYTVLGDPRAFFADDMVPGPLIGAPHQLWRLLTPVLPAFIWLGTPGLTSPAGRATRQPPSRLDGDPSTHNSDRGSAPAGEPTCSRLRANP